MRLTRNTTIDGHCKYALVRLDKLRDAKSHPSEELGAIAVLSKSGILEFGEPGTEEECFVIKLKDKFAPLVLRQYAWEALVEDPELSKDVLELAARAENHPNRKRPD